MTSQCLEYIKSVINVMFLSLVCSNQDPKEAYIFQIRTQKKLIHSCLYFVDTSLRSFSVIPSSFSPLHLLVEETRSSVLLFCVLYFSDFILQCLLTSPSPLYFQKIDSQRYFFLTLQRKTVSQMPLLVNVNFS